MPCSASMTKSSSSNTRVYPMASSRFKNVRFEPGVSRCRPTCSALMPPDADTMVVSTASDATNCADCPLRFCSSCRIEAWTVGIWGRKSASSSATPSTEKPGTLLTMTSTHISSGKDAVSRNSVADPA